MLTCWQSHHFGSGPVQMSPLWPSFQHGCLWPGVGPFAMEQVHYLGDHSRSLFNTHISVPWGRSCTACFSSLCIWPWRGLDFFFSVIKRPGAKARRLTFLWVLSSGCDASLIRWGCVLWASVIPECPWGSRSFSVKWHWNVNWPRNH